jgi:hypothetical protein
MGEETATTFAWNARKKQKNEKAVNRASRSTEARTVATQRKKQNDMA